MPRRDRPKAGRGKPGRAELLVGRTGPACAKPEAGINGSKRAWERSEEAKSTFMASRAGTDAPELDTPKAEGQESSRARLRGKGEDPRRATSEAKGAAPTWASDRIKAAEPDRALLATGSEDTKPKRAQPDAEADGSERARLRRRGEDPRQPASSAESENPKRPELRGNVGKPMCRDSMTESVKTLPNCTKPRVKTKRPRWQKLRRDREEPKPAELDAEAAKSKHVELLTRKEGGGGRTWSSKNC